MPVRKQTWELHRYGPLRTNCPQLRRERGPRPVEELYAGEKKYRHGVGRVGARDKTSGTPVTTFRRSNFLYKTAMRYNRGLDRDKDGIACEKL